MKEYKLLFLTSFAQTVAALPDFSHVVHTHPGGEPDKEDDFKFGPFFQIFTGIPPNPTAVPRPEYPLPTMKPMYSKPPPQHTQYHPPTPSPSPVSRPSPKPPTPPPYPTPHPSPVADPAMPPVYKDPHPHPDWPTRTAFYQHQWGGVSDSCQYKAPESLIKCLDGGILLLQDRSNAHCENLALDVVKCSQLEYSEDAIVDFQCVGNTARHLTANVRTVPSEAKNCNSDNMNGNGSNAMAAASLGRYCKDVHTGEVELQTWYPCVEGEAGFLDGTTFCKSFGRCSGDDCDAFISPVSITAHEEEPLCSTPEIHRDLTDFRFNPSSLASYHRLQWTFSDLGFGCQWDVPDIEVACRSGGMIELVQHVPFCHLNPVSNTMVCTNPTPGSMNGRIIVELEFWCYGNAVEQLVLDVGTLPLDSSGHTCEPEGILVHGLDIARGCGDPSSKSYTLIQSPDFCADPSQFQHDICFAGFNCPAGSQSCDDVTLDFVAADTSDVAVSSCVFAEQLP